MANDYYGNVSGAQSCSSSRWLTEEVFKLIDMVQHDEAIYNPRHKYYFCRPYVETFWREVDQKLEKNPGASLAKWTNLRISFRREYTNYLEEKVPPCWTYFDRMFFLHPYLRKKHSTPKSLDSQVQDALVRSISSLSNRLHRERTAAAATVGTAAVLSTSSDSNAAQLHNLPTHQHPIDNYLEYFDDPEQNNSDDLDDVMDDEQQRRTSYRNAETHDRHPTINNDIKSECDDVKSDVDEYEPESAVRQEEVDNELLEEMEMRNFMMDSYASSSTQQNSLEDKRAHLRMQHLMRLQARAYQEEMPPRIKRPRSQESISSTQMNNSGTGSGSAAAAGAGSGVGSSATATSTIGSSATNATSTNLHSRMHYSTAGTASIHANVSLVRPTLAKPVELVSTTTSNNGSSGGLSVGSGITNSASSNNTNMEIADLNASSTSLSNNSQLTSSSTIMNHHHQPRYHHPNSNHHSNHIYNNSSGVGSSSSGINSNHRLEFSSISASSGTATANSVMPTSGGTTTAATLIHSPPIANALAPVASTNTTTTTTHMELCDCKTDPDAMFLMSLLPDIQKLNGRDRGKIKIAFQNILQDYLYPD